MKGPLTPFRKLFILYYPKEDMRIYIFLWNTVWKIGHPIYYQGVIIRKWYFLVSIQNTRSLGYYISILLALTETCGVLPTHRTIWRNFKGVLSYLELYRIPLPPLPKRKCAKNTCFVFGTYGGWINPYVF